MPTSWFITEPPSRFTHSENCICFGCRSRRRRMEREAAIERRILVDASVARTHVLSLVAKGVHKSEIARRAGCSPALISKVLQTGSSVNEATHEALMKVKP